MATIQTKSQKKALKDVEQTSNFHIEDEDKLIAQIQAEYNYSRDTLVDKKDQWGKRLKLYVNNKRDPEAIGDSLIFKIHQTVLASLYDDKLSVRFQPRERGDIDIADNLNELAKFDYKEMKKNKLDYFWSWDATFFGLGYVLMMSFDKDKNIPIPRLLDPLDCFSDPTAISINGDIDGNARSRFFGWRDTITMRDIDNNPNYFNKDKIKSQKSDQEVDNRQYRQEAQGMSININNRLCGDNEEINITRWFTFWKGKRVYVELTSNNSNIIRYLDSFDSDDIPVIERSIYPMSHDMYGVSVVDLIEDKQRARATVKNLALKNVKKNLYPRMAYDTDKITSAKDLNYDLNKHIGTKGNPANAVIPLQSAQINAEVQWILSTIDSDAQTATATPDIQQGGAMAGNVTATELNQIAKGVDTRYSLSAKIFGWSEEEFWSQWYKLYKKFFNNKIDEKVLRLRGELNDEWRVLSRDNIIANTDPDIEIESEVLSEIKRIKEMQGMANYIGLVMQSPDSNKLYVMRRFGRISGISDDDIDGMLPPTVDELEAEAENAKLDQGIKVDIKQTDNDVVHLEIHNKLSSNLPQKRAHIIAHRDNMQVKKELQNRAVNSEQQQGSQQGMSEVSARQTAPVAGMSNRMDNMSINNRR